MLSRDEYEKRYNDNYRLEGYGLTMLVHSPCPFCAAPDFNVYTLDKMQEATCKETVCRECGRGLRIDYADDGTTLSSRMMQTCGEPGPSYVPIPRAAVLE